MKLNIHHLCKAFAAPVLKGVSLTLESGRIHGLVGENGAGKSTLINILSGVITSDSGEITLDDNPYKPTHVRASLAAGVSVASQELSLIEHLSVAENIFLTSLPQRWGVLNKRAIAEQAIPLMNALGLEGIDLHVAVSQLSLAQKQLVELAKALSTARRLLILDEPTAALTGPQADRLHKILREKAAQGMMVLYVSHRLQDVVELCDSISVLREGEIQFTKPSGELSSQQLIEAMSGQTFSASHNEQARAVGEPRLHIQQLTTRDLPHPIDLVCHASEIVGVAGLAGAGRTELLQAIFGVVPALQGSVELIENNQTLLVTSASQAVKHGIGYVAEDRKTQGIFTDKSIAFNTTLAGLKKIANRFGFINESTEQNAVTHLIRDLQVKCDNQAQWINRLSGGNQQKIMIGRWVHAGATVLLLDEPTRGVDPQAKQAIHDQLRLLRDQGAAMLVVSSEMEELTSLCDRIVVLSDRKLVATFSRGNWTHDDILQAAFSAHTRARVS